MPDPVTPPTVVPTPPPAPAAPAAGAPPPPGEKPKIDPWMQHMAESIGMAVSDDITLLPATPEPPKPGKAEPENPQAPRTISEIGMESVEREKAKKTAAEAGSAAPAPPAPAAPAAPPAPAPGEGAPPAPPKPIEVRRASVDELAARVTKDVMEQVGKLQKPAAPPAPPVPAAPDAEAQWESTLPEENREMLELLRWGEANGMDALKGKATEQASYFRRLEDFLKSNPEEEARNDWIAKNKPALSDRLLRKAAEERILNQAEERAAERIRKENAPRLADIEAKQRASEVRPLVDAAAREFNERFEANVVGDKTRTGTPRIPSAIVKKLHADGLDAATEAFPIEAPIVHQFETAAREFLDLRGGLVAHDGNNPQHQFLGNFIFRQEQALLAQPEEKRVVNGKPFLAGSVYYAELAKDPTVANRFSTFTDQNVLDMLEESAHRAVKKEYDRLEKAGFARKAAPTPAGDPAKPTEGAPVAPAANGAPNPGVNGDAGAPRAGASKAPGAAVGAGNETNPNLSFLKKIHPDAERILAQ